MDDMAEFFNDKSKGTRMNNPQYIKDIKDDPR